MALQIGLLLYNRYRIAATIASGGMGAIYRAADETLGISVAVKENFFSTEEFSRQFRREATILAGLRHPNLPRVTDHFVIPGAGQYLVMDFIEGLDLRNIISNQGSLLVDDVVRVGVAICDALEYMHTRSPAIVHRDIKPGNLKITPEGKVFLVDFGLAKLSHGEATTVGAQALTPGYAPPEQYGQGTEPRSDLYSLGATLYAALTGKVPADGLSRIMGSADLAAIQSYNPQVPLALAKVIEQSMLVHLEQRFQTAGEFKNALIASMPDVDLEKPVMKQDQTKAAVPERFYASQQPVAVQHAVEAQQPTQRGPLAEPSTPPISSPKTKRAGLFPVLIGLVVVFAMLGISALLILPRVLSWASQPTAVAAVTVQPSQTARSIVVEEASQTPAVLPSPSASVTVPPTDTPAPTGTQPALPSDTPAPAVTAVGGGAGQIAFSSDRGGAMQIWLAGLDGSFNQVTRLADGACQPDWSPDGERLVFISPCEAYQEDYSGSSLYIIDMDGTGLVPLASLPGGDFDPAWSPDGNSIAFTSLRDNGVPHIYLYNLADHTARRLSRVVNYERQAAWSPDGQWLAYQTTRQGQPQVWVMDPAGENAREFSTLAGSFEWKPVWSPDGSILVYSQGNPSQLVARQVSDKQAREFPLSDNVRPAEGADFSPDGWWLVFERKQAGNLDIYYMLRNGSSLARLTDGEGLDFHPAWRPAQP